jgi:hypothetical protein
MMLGVTLHPVPSAIPLWRRSVLAGAIVVGVVGALAGLIQGLRTYPPTAWFAVFELGVPAAIVGGVLGLTCGVFASVVRTMRRQSSA